MGTSDKSENASHQSTITMSQTGLMTNGLSATNTDGISTLNNGLTTMNNGLSTINNGLSTMTAELSTTGLMTSGLSTVGHMTGTGTSHICWRCKYAVFG